MLRNFFILAGTDVSRAVDFGNTGGGGWNNQIQILRSVSKWYSHTSANE
jgi:hypothetical protein